MIPVNVHDLTVDENQEDYVIVLNGKNKSDEKWLPILISSTEAQNIAILLNNMEPDPPPAHDLLAELTETLGGTVEGVRLETGPLNELLGRIDVSTPEPQETVTLDASPSDAIAVALRTDVEIVVEEDIMKSGKPGNTESADFSRLPDELTRLRDELEEAVRNENFERAADLKNEIRDTIRIHEESIDQLDGAIEARLRWAYEGTRAMEPSDDN